jgi:hypothetical protein
MKLLAKNGDVQYLQSLRQRLEENGIPATIQGENTARMLVPSVAFEPTLWVYIDEQYAEARELLGDPEHVVSNRVDVSSFYANLPSESEQRELLSGAFHHMGMVAGVLVLVILFLLIILWQ